MTIATYATLFRFLFYDTQSNVRYLKFYKTLKIYKNKQAMSSQNLKSILLAWKCHSRNITNIIQANEKYACV